MSINKSYKPNSFLKRHIDRYYLFKSNKYEIPRAPTIFLGTGLELVFHLGQPFSINGEKLPVTHTICPRKTVKFDKVEQLNFLSVRFKSGAFRHFSPLKFMQLNDNFHSVNDLWKENGNVFIEKFNREANIAEKINLLESFLTKCFNQYYNKKNAKWDLIIDDLYYNFNSTTIKELSEKHHFSLRQLERGFKSQFGITAKKFQNITRFQNIVKTNLLNKKSDYLNSVFDNGYFDQSHFIREFKTNTDKTPLEYFTEENFENHLYHNSINK